MCYYSEVLMKTNFDNNNISNLDYAVCPTNTLPRQTSGSEIVSEKYIIVPYTMHDICASYCIPTNHPAFA